MHKISLLNALSCAKENDFDTTALAVSISFSNIWCQ